MFIPLVEVPLELVAPRRTGNIPETVGVPEIRPVDEFKLSPVGRPVAE
jgi:hypothetical protein